MINGLDADHTEVYSLESLKMVFPEGRIHVSLKTVVNHSLIFLHTLGERTRVTNRSHPEDGRRNQCFCVQFERPTA